MKVIKRITAVILVFMLLSTQAYAANTVPNNNVVYPQPTAPLKKALPAATKPDAAKALAIAEKYYKLALAKATSEEKSAISSAIYWKPDFTGKTTNTAIVSMYSYSPAFLTNYTDLKGLYLALNSAVFVLDIKNATSAGNLASSIIAYSEDTVKKPLGIALKNVKTYADDAAVVYEYALSLKLSAALLDMGSMPILLNYGYVCIDTGKLPTAKVLFETATKMVPSYLPAKEGMAAYWLAVKDPAKAKKALEGALMPAFYKNIKKMGEDSSDKKAPQVEVSDDLATMEEKLESLSKVPTVLATDFYTDIDPEGTANARKFVDDIAKQWKFNSPGYSYLTEFSTLAAFTSGAGQAAFDGFVSELQMYSLKYAGTQFKSSQNQLNNMGVDISVSGIDINDVINNPEKYKDSDLGDNIQVNGIDELMKKMQDLLKQAGQAASDLKKGDTGSTMDLAASVAPEFGIFKMNPGDYANPTDIMTQQYNMTILLRKIIGYKNYFYKQNKDIADILKDDMKKLTDKMKELQKGMDKELQQLADEHASGAHDSENGGNNGGEGIFCDICRVKTHKIHQTYDPQMNQLSETVWMDATNYVSSLYTKKVKSNIEALYSECMKNCMLISDTHIRKLKEDEIKSLLYGTVVNFMSNVATAYSIGVSGYPYHCECDEEEINAARERIQKAYDEKEYNKTIMENKARQEFEQGVIKESSQLYKNLDKYSAELNLLFMHAKWHPLKTELSFNVKVPSRVGKGQTPLEAGATFKMVTNHVNNNTSYKGGLSASAGTSYQNGAIGIKGTVSVEGSVTTDGNGNVIQADVVGTAQGSVTSGWVKSTGTYEASVMRGCKLSGEVAQVYNDSLKPPGMSKDDKAIWNKITDTTKIYLPEKPKKVLWKGEYQISK